jgi:hypothetical protein
MSRRSRSILDDSEWRSHRQRNALVAAAVVLAFCVAVLVVIIWTASSWPF